VFPRQGISGIALPICDPAFFKQAIFQHGLGPGLLQLHGLLTQALDLVTGGLALSVARQSVAASLQKLLAPAVILELVQPLAAAQLRDAVLAAKSLQYHADFVFRAELAPRPALDVADGLLDRPLVVLFLSPLRSVQSLRGAKIITLTITL